MCNIPRIQKRSYRRIEKKWSIIFNGMEEMIKNSQEILRSKKVKERGSQNQIIYIKYKEEKSTDLDERNN